MQKKSRWKLIICILFVVSAGIFYFRMPRTEAGEVLQEEKQAAADGPTAPLPPENTDLQTEIVAGQAGTGGEDAPELRLLYIHVCGSVKNPGVYCLPENSRVVEAIEAAGGFLSTAAADYLNQAELLYDGQKIYVPNEQEAEELLKAGNLLLKEQQASGNGGTVLPGGGTTETGSTLININTAGVSQLTELAGIGKTRAEAIIDYREKHGRFENCEDLMKVPGIKEAVYQKICDRITTGN